uniref:Uncharacterized protein n=1 Tax=Arundo donax TaxID=35708 RepID=A0A0A8YWH0_ARUDO
MFRLLSEVKTSSKKGIRWETCFHWNTTSHRKQSKQNIIALSPETYNLANLFQHHVGRVHIQSKID